MNDYDFQKCLKDYGNALRDSLLLPNAYWKGRKDSGGLGGINDMNTILHDKTEIALTITNNLIRMIESRDKYLEQNKEKQG